MTIWWDKQACLDLSGYGKLGFLRLRENQISQGTKLKLFSCGQPLILTISLFEKSCNMIIFPLRKRSPCFNVIISQNQYLAFLSLVSSNFLGVKDRVADSDVYICHPSTAWIPKPEWVKSNLLNIASAYFSIKKTNIAMHCINLFFKTSSVWNYRLCT